MSFHTVARLVSGLPFAMGPCGVFFGRLMKSAECAWGTGTPLRMLLTKSTTTVNGASSNCPNSRYSSKSWYGTVAAARWMMARRLAMVAQGGGPSEAPAHPVMAWTRERVPLAQLVQRNGGLLMEWHWDAYNVDRIRRGYISRSQSAAVVHLGGLAGGGG